MQATSKAILVCHCLPPAAVEMRLRNSRISVHLAAGYIYRSVKTRAG